MFNFNKEQVYFLISALTGKVINFFGNTNNIESILVIKLDEIGDMVYSLHVFKYIEKAFPNVPVTLLCKPFVKPLVQNIPNIKSIIHDIPQNTKYSLIIELRGNWNTLLFAIKNKPNYRLDRGTVRLTNKIKGLKKHEIYTNFDIIKPLLNNEDSIQFPEITLDEKSAITAENYISKYNLKNFAILHCGARNVLRQWAPKNFAQIANFLIKKYNLQIVFAGTAEDESIIDNVISLGNIEALKCTRDFTLLNFAHLVQKAAIYIGNESGPLHIAAVMGTPLVGIYGPGIKDVFYPIGINSKVVHHILICNPCNQIKCVRPENPCINLVTVEEVKTKIEELLD